MEEVTHHYLILIRKNKIKRLPHLSITIRRLLVDMLEKLTQAEMEFLVILDPVRIERLQNSFSIILPIKRMHSGAVNATLL